MTLANLASYALAPLLVVVIGIFLLRMFVDYKMLDEFLKILRGFVEVLEKKEQSAKMIADGNYNITFEIEEKGWCHDEIITCKRSGLKLRATFAGGNDLLLVYLEGGWWYCKLRQKHTANLVIATCCLRIIHEKLGLKPFVDKT